MPKNKSRIYLLFLLLFHFAQVLVLESIWLRQRYTLFYVNVDHLVNKSRCQTCLNVNNTDAFQSFVTKESYKIVNEWDSKYIIYLFSCKACGLQYVGSTVERFLFRWNNYKNIKLSKGGSTRGYAITEFFFTNIFLVKDIMV